MEGQAGNPEHNRFVAANQLAHAGYRDEAFPILRDIALNGSDRVTRYDCLYILWQMGDERSRQVMEDAGKIPGLSDSASSFLSRWQKGCRGFSTSK